VQTIAVELDGVGCPTKAKFAARSPAGTVMHWPDFICVATARQLLICTPQGR
jgi:hypothetical protein